MRTEFGAWINRFQNEQRVLRHVAAERTRPAKRFNVQNSAVLFKI